MRVKRRDPVEDALLLRSALESMRRREQEGRLVQVGPRLYELRSAQEATAASTRSYSSPSALGPGGGGTLSVP
jgi:hypothetical protein